ncbi:hypothetical protein [Streptomyces paromomycinus]|uniref:hypothetical protein n=1 Tax=Streptomyces paromomycinus TaxID=92743 RepID=UPI00147891D5|nr:hypothetical protein [Streptomyces paromomycinus]
MACSGTASQPTVWPCTTAPSSEPTTPASSTSPWAAGSPTPLLIAEHRARDRGEGSGG